VRTQNLSHHSVSALPELRALRVPVAAAVLLLVAGVLAQAPGEPRASTPPDTALQSLQLLTAESVYTRQPLAASPQNPPTPAPAPAPASGTQNPAPPQGTTADLPFAAIRDAEFDGDGRLLALIVAHVPKSGAADPTLRLLPAKSVRWDPASKRWLTVEPTLVWAELPEVSAPRKPEKAPVAAIERRKHLASELLAATFGQAPTPAPAEPAVEVSTKPTKARITWWLAPEHQQLAFAVVPYGDKSLPIPFALVRTNGSGDAVTVRVESAAGMLDHAPVTGSANEPPASAVRHRCYEYFGAAAPKWERPPEPPRDGKSGKG
jgi:hypothetical protein